MVRHILALVLLGASGATITGAAIADDVDSGRALYVERGCVNCHGLRGQSQQPYTPNLGGQHAEYLVLALRAYRDGARQNPTMQSMAALLSVEETDLVARYLAAQ